MGLVNFSLGLRAYCSAHYALEKMNESPILLHYTSVAFSITSSKVWQVFSISFLDRVG
jgi:hypothetical protein